MDEAFTRLQLEAEAAVLATGRLDGAEELIERSDFDGEQKSALWLYAWSLLPADHQRAMALRYLEEVEGDRWSF